MRTTTLRISKARVKRERRKEVYYCVTLPKPGGGRTRRFFKFTPEGKREAETFLQIAKVQQINYGTAAFSITDALRSEAVQCAKKLAEHGDGRTLTEAVDFFLAHLQSSENSIAILDAVERLIAKRRDLGRSPRYCNDLRLRLGRFAADFPGTTIGGLTAHQIEGWLGHLPVAAGTRNTFRRDIRTLLSYCEKKGLCRTNEAKKTELATSIDKPVSILTVTQATTLLTECDDQILPYIAISLFAGLRASEVQKLDWSEVDLESALIEVTAAKSKTAKRRLVPISENLDAWIRPLAKIRGPIAPDALRKRFEAVRALAGFQEWPQNAMRHSFGSYRVAICQDVARVSLEMGNSPNMVHNHYREVVRPKQAELYWKIAPAAVGKKVIRFAANSA
ncbi:MAG: tyrosine-type recombinase/integrase [Blastocatellia bacterium]|nr:tyrosine-type recombinase/integrase [Blastocatellia bacterium]